VNLPQTPVLSYEKSNRELVAAFERYFSSMGKSPTTVRAYRISILALVKFLGARSMGEVDRDVLRQFLAKMRERGLCPNTIRLRTCALRSFFRFIRLAGLSTGDPTLLLAQRKIPNRIQRVLTIKEVEQLIAAARTPFERAVIEVLYATGVRVSELVNLRFEDVRADEGGSQIGSIRVHNGKGGEDRIVLFGKKAAQAIRAHRKSSSPNSGFLFEAPARNGSLRPYTTRAIVGVIHRVARRVKIGGVYPHALRRAFASHMLASGGDLRAIQELLGHKNLRTTTLYTGLTAENLKAVHERTHPHEKER
jgi:site-specific recombinase XerD